MLEAKGFDFGPFLRLDEECEAGRLHGCPTVVNHAVRPKKGFWCLHPIHLCYAHFLPVHYPRKYSGSKVFSAFILRENANISNDICTIDYV